MNKRRLMKKKRRDYKRDAMKARAAVGILFAWRLSDIAYSFDPISLVPILYCKGQVYDICPSCGCPAGKHLEFRNEGRQYISAKCPGEDIPKIRKGNSFWNLKCQNYAGYTKTDGIWQATVYGGQDRERLNQVNEIWRDV